MRTTIFTLPKPFVDPLINMTQRNAISSWKSLPQTEILILGDEEGIESASKELGVRHTKDVTRRNGGLPLLNHAFQSAQQLSQSEFFVYTNADIIFFDDLIDVVNKLPKENFLALGRRTDLDITTPIDFNKPEEINKLKATVKKEGRLHSAAGIDYFIFRKNSLQNLPDLIVGRVGWDNWMIYNALKNNTPVIDLTADVLAIHQNHPARAQNDTERKTNPEALHNLSLMPRQKLSYTIDDANFKSKNGVLHKNYLSFLRKLKRSFRI